MQLSNRTSTIRRAAVGSVFDATDRAFARIVKRAFDIVVAAAGLVLFSPTLLLVSIAIKIDSPGPVFRQRMLHGYNNENIHLLTFRTTTITEEQRGTSTAIRLGRVLRRTGIDRLPQLINVLLGDISIVGPSPYVADLNSDFAEHILLIQQRPRMKPGIVGWAQVNDRPRESDKLKRRRRIEFDLYYVENWSLLFDIKIVLMAVFSKDAHLD